MMKIETIVGDVVLLVLQEIESLKEMGIQKNRFMLKLSDMMKMEFGLNILIFKFQRWKIQIIKIQRL